MSGRSTVRSKTSAACVRGNCRSRSFLDLVAIYDQGIRYADYWIGELMKGLRERALYDNTVIVVLADHGEELFDHGGLEHSKTFYEQVMRIPLVVRVPHTAHG